MSHCITPENYDTRVLLLSLAGDAAEQCGKLLNNDKSLTLEQRAIVLMLQESCWAAQDEVRKLPPPKVDSIPFGDDPEPMAAIEPLLAAMEE